MSIRRYLRIRLAAWLADIADRVMPEPETVDDLVGSDLESPVVSVRVFRVDSDAERDEAIGRKLAQAERRKWN